MHSALCVKRLRAGVGDCTNPANPPVSQPSHHAATQPAHTPAARPHAHRPPAQPTHTNPSPSPPASCAARRRPPRSASSSPAGWPASGGRATRGRPWQPLKQKRWGRGRGSGLCQNSRARTGAGREAGRELAARWGVCHADKWAGWTAGKPAWCHLLSAGAPAPQPAILHAMPVILCTRL